MLGNGIAMTVQRPRLSESLSHLLERRAAARPDAAAIVWGDEVIGLGIFLDESRRIAQGLADFGIGKGDRVALWLPNTPAWLALYFACARLGAIAVAVNTRFRSAEIADIIGRSGARLLVLWPDFRRIDFLGILGEVDRAALDRLEGIIAYGRDPPAIWGRPCERGSNRHEHPLDPPGSGHGTSER